MDYKISIFLRQRWTDSRLQHNSPGDLLYLKSYNIFNDSHRGESYHMIWLNLLVLEGKIAPDASYLDRLWLPDLFFNNEKSSRFHSIWIDNKLFRVSNDGEITYRLIHTYSESWFMNVESLKRNLVCGYRWFLPALWICKNFQWTIKKFSCNSSVVSNYVTNIRVSAK